MEQTYYRVRTPLIVVALLSLALAGCGDSSPVEDSISTPADLSTEANPSEELEDVESEPKTSPPLKKKSKKSSKFNAEVLLREEADGFVNFYILSRDAKRQAKACASEAADEGDPDAYEGILCYAFDSRSYYGIDDAVCWEYRGERTDDGEIVVEDGHSPASFQSIRDEVGCP